MDWLKAIYETFGTPYPRASLIAVMALGAILFGALWLVLARQVQNAAASQNVPSQVTGSAATGDGGVANTGNGNTINSSPPEKKSPKKD